jgi:hypothetical protein
MIPDWARNLLVRCAIGVVILVALVHGVGTAGASDLTVSPASIAVSFDFDQPKDTAHYETQRAITITNTNPDPNSTISGTISTISGDISITPSPSSFSLHGGESLPVALTIVADPSASQGTQSFTIHVGEEQVTVTVTITHYAKITISPASIDFGQVSRTERPTETVRITEEYGYKGVTVNLVRSGNSWMTREPDGTISIPAGGHKDVSFQLAPGTPDHNEYYWTFSLSSPTSYTTITQSSIAIEAYILMPPKLGRLYDEELEMKFDKPKGTVSSYEREIEVRVRNDGDETLSFTSRFTESPGGITIRIVNPSGSVSGKSSGTIRLRIVAPFDALEGAYRGKLEIKAGEAGSGSVEITIVIKWPVDVSIAPTSIDFGSLELEERGYEMRSENITITELFRYKPVRNLRFSATGEYGNWLKAEQDFAEIPPGESGTVILKIEPGLEAVPRNYAWTYNIGASEIAAKRIAITAKIVPLNISRAIEGLQSFRGTPVYNKYPSSESIIANGIAMLEGVERREIGTEDWAKIPVLMTGTLSLLSSLNDGIVFTEAANYGSAVESLSSAPASTATIESNSDLNNRYLAGYATVISAEADNTTAAVLRDEAKLLELRGWSLKKAVEHALAIDDISSLNEEENVLEAALSYQYAAMLYGLLNAKEKRLENVYEGSVLMDRHDELVSDATDLRLRAETSIATSKKEDLTRIWDSYLLFNPYHYDTFVASYRTAEDNLEAASQKYKVAGERFLYEQTEEELNQLQSELRSVLIFFFIACALYGVLLLYVITRIARGTMTYLRDVSEREVGEILVTG